MANHYGIPTRIRPPYVATITDGGVIVDHGALAGLGDDDHIQYFNQTRADAWFLTKSHTLLTDLVWTASGHTGSPDCVAGFDSSGEAVHLALGSVIQEHDPDLDALAALTGTGYLVRTGTETYAERTITAGSAAITITDGDGVSGNTVIDVGPSVLTTSATLSGDVSGTLGATTVTDLTISGATNGSVLYYNGTNWVQLAPGTSGDVLTTNGAAAPSWNAPSGGGTTDHAALTTNMNWTSSGHTGTGGTIAGFSGGGTAAEYTIGVDIQGYDADLAALAGLGSNGILVKTSAGNAATREIVGTAGLITVNNGDGVSGNPTINVGADVITTSTAATGDVTGNFPNLSVNDGADSTAIHSNLSAEINGIPSKTTPVGADVLIIEDSANLFAKRSITISSLTTASGGEANDALNINTSGLGFFSSKNGVNLEFYGLDAIDSKANISLNGTTNAIELTIADTSTTQAGAIELATQTEVNSGIDTVRAVTPATLAGATNIINTSTVAGGDLAGTYPNPTVTGLSLAGSQGDILYYNGVNWVNLAAGTVNDVLTTGGPGANPSWSTPSSGGNSASSDYVPYIINAGTTQTSTFTAVIGETHIVDLSSGGFTANLPAIAAGNGRIGFYISAEGGQLTLDPNGAETIEGKSTIKIQQGHNTIENDGTGWKKVQKTGRGSLRLDDNPSTNQNNYAPTDWERQVTHLYLNPGADLTITGFEEDNFIEGDDVIIVNISTLNTITIEHNSSSSTANNRVLMEGSNQILIPPYAVATIVRDGTANLWRLKYVQGVIVRSDANATAVIGTDLSPQLLTAAYVEESSPYTDTRDFRECVWYVKVHNVGSATEVTVKIEWSHDGTAMAPQGTESISAGASTLDVYEATFPTADISSTGHIPAIILPVSGPQAKFSIKADTASGTPTASVYVWRKV